MEDMTEQKLAETLQSLIECNCIDVEEEDRCFPEVSECKLNGQDGNPYLVEDSALIVSMPNGQRFLVRVQEV